MTRAPFNVLVFPYRPAGEHTFEYALLRRADGGYWHTMAGGGEDGETPLEAARRETHEETGIPSDSVFLQLDTLIPVPVTGYAGCDHWREDIYVIPQYCFGVLAGSAPIAPSREHIEYQWLAYPQAHHLVRYEGSKTALWELDRKLRSLGPWD